MAFGTVQADVIGTSVAGSNLGAGNASIMKNRIINGAMVIDQRNSGASLTPTTNAYTTDRWSAQISQSSKLSYQQVTTAPAGFSNSMKITSLSSYSVASGDYFLFNQAIEGFNTADLGWGTANAKTVTLSFWVQSSLTGTFGGSVFNYAGGYGYPFSYSIPVANTWTQISITITGATSSTWASTNSGSVIVNFGLGVGSTYSGTAGSWVASEVRSATGAVSVVGTNGATFYITGVQLEVGSSATGFEYRQYGQELQLCQRYCYVASNPMYVGTVYSSTVISHACSPFPVTMRATPTTTLTGTITWQAGTNSISATSLSATYSSQNAFDSDVTTSSSSFSAGQCAMARTNSSTYTLINSAEL
jgi:hypothetical protein